MKQSQAFSHSKQKCKESDPRPFQLFPRHAFRHHGKQLRNYTSQPWKTNYFNVLLQKHMFKSFIGV